MTKFSTSYKKRKSTAKNEKEKSENSKEIIKCIRDDKRSKRRKISKDLAKSQRYKEHVQYQISEEANPHPQSQKQRR